jgi:hypothetical protein
VSAELYQVLLDRVTRSHLDNEPAL